MPRLKRKPIAAASARTRCRMVRLQASKGAPWRCRSLANQATSYCQGSTVTLAGSGTAATSSSLTSWGTPSRAAPVNSSEPAIIWPRWASGTALALLTRVQIDEARQGVADALGPQVGLQGGDRIGGRMPVNHQTDTRAGAD